MPYLGRGGAERTSFKWTNSYATSCSLDGTARTIHRPPDLGSSLISAQTSSQPANIYIHHSQIQRRAIIIISVVSYVSIRPKYNTTWNQLSIIYRCTWVLSKNSVCAINYCISRGSDNVRHLVVTFQFPVWRESQIRFGDKVTKSDSKICLSVCNVRVCGEPMTCCLVLRIIHGSAASTVQN